MEEDLAAIKLEIKGLFQHHSTIHAIFSEAYRSNHTGVSSVMFEKLCATEKLMTTLSNTAETVLGSGFDFSTPFTDMLSSLQNVDYVDDNFDLHLWIEPDSDCDGFVSDVETDSED